MACWAQDCCHISIDPFGEHRTTRRRKAIRELYENKSANWRDKKLNERQVLSANKERGILNTWVSWTAKDGQEWACNYISMIHLDEQNKCAKYTEWNVARARE